MLKSIKSIGIFTLAIALATSLVACGDNQLEACRILEIEDAEVEVDLGDVDVERGEVEMICGGEKVVDVTWGEFRQKLGIDPGRYQNNLKAFEQQVSCLKEDRSSNNVVFCRRGNSNEMVSLNFSDDD
ncbi:hypothetical protein [Limnoraphis robusta]|uniref:Uncharacterized protein n=1 Tax=Limnoraphis robusta CCNP1315 TaxID=3110306 RepID=A0ABU5U0P1_9CYAN|nr:hypothetical protein [Limnoraphis robusta]MEA5520654.1 hypothetical protein [Limnoraphis robusta CCNP1315]MEA5545632.1 hypothetical protein [Limnoraphis robusta CCNP1324]